MVYDGSALWFYLPKTNQYGSVPASALTADAPGDLGDMRPEAVDEFMMLRFARLANWRQPPNFFATKLLISEGPRLTATCSQFLPQSAAVATPGGSTRGATLFCARTAAIPVPYSLRSGSVNPSPMTCSRSNHRLKRRESTYSNELRPVLALAGPRSELAQTIREHPRSCAAY